MKRIAIATTSVWLAALWPGGCSGPSPYGKDIYENFQSESPAVRIHACIQAANDRDPKVVTYLVDRLSDSETDVRVYATLALEKITGTRMGYEYYDPPDRRTKAIDQWRKWLAAGRPDVKQFLKQMTSQSAPASEPAGQLSPAAESVPASEPAGKPLETDNASKISPAASTPASAVATMPTGNTDRSQ